MAQERPRALYILGSGSYELIYGPDEQRDIARLVDLAAAPLTAEQVAADVSVLPEIEVILSGWGGPVLDAAFLQAAPRLRGFFYGAGATGGLVRSEAYERGITVVSAADANAVPVAEYTVAAILFSLKQVFRLQRDTREAKAYPRSRPTLAGAYGSTIGLISLGAIGRLVTERLRAMPLEVNIIAYDPFVRAEDAEELGIERVETLEEIFTRSDVVSLHTPWLPETERMIRGSHLSAMKPGATFINTARGAVVAEDEMLTVLAERPDVTAVLDVVHPEPPAPDSPLYTLPNVFLTPHIAGSLDQECRRMGRLIVDELTRWLNGEPLHHEVRPDAAAHSSHRAAR